MFIEGIQYEYEYAMRGGSQFGNTGENVLGIIIPVLFCSNDEPNLFKNFNLLHMNHS